MGRLPQALRVGAVIESGSTRRRGQGISSSVTVPQRRVDAHLIIVLPLVAAVLVDPAFLVAREDI